MPGCIAYFVSGLLQFTLLLKGVPMNTCVKEIILCFITGIMVNFSTRLSYRIVNTIVNNH